jgi:hypothetical protein
MRGKSLMTLAVGAAVAAAVWLWWYRSVPHDLALATIEIGRISDYADLAWTYPPKHGSYVARISFTSSDDLRTVMTADRGRDGSYGFLLTATHCGCNENSAGRYKGACGIEGFGLYDRYGMVDHRFPHSQDHISSKASGDGAWMTYHTYVDMSPWDDTRGPFDLIRKPVDVCMMMTRYGDIQASADSNVVRIPAAAFAAAVERAHLR